MGKFTQPSGAPDNHVLCTYSPGNAHFHSAHTVKWDGETLLDSGIYLIKGGKPIDEPGKMFLIKNDPIYNEQWPRALVPYERIYGVKEPKNLPRLANDGKLSKHLPEGTPFGLVGADELGRPHGLGTQVAPVPHIGHRLAGGLDADAAADPCGRDGLRAELRVEVL